MNPRYLRSVSILGFRIFKEIHLDFEAPGITFLVGQNGLGKSSVFEAVEWALTGEVSEDNAKLSTITTMPPPTPARAPMPSHRQNV